jgi:hypothetical protein
MNCTRQFVILLYAIRYIGYTETIQSLILRDKPMNPTLTAFLQETELDDLLTLAGQIDQLDDDDRAAVEAVVAQWSDQQAVANLLMYPHILPPGIRRETVLKGLHEPVKSYLTLAAVVGLQDRCADFEADHDAIIERLTRITRTAPPVINNRASITLVECSRAADADDIVGIMSHPDNTVKHNILAALINTIGVAAIPPLIEAASADYRLLNDGKAFAQAKLRELEPLLNADGELDESNRYNTSLNAPLLSYIPNLVDFQV